MVSAEEDGAQLKETDGFIISLTIRGNENISKWGDDSTTATFTTDPGCIPAQIDVMKKSDSVIMRGVYELDGEKLKLCFRNRGEGRPTEFKSEENVALIVLRRVK